MADMVTERARSKEQFETETAQELLQRVGEENPGLGWILAEATAEKGQTRNFKLPQVDLKNIVGLVTQVRHDRFSGVRTPVISEWGDRQNPFGLGVAEAQARFILPNSIKGKERKRLLDTFTHIAALAEREFHLASLLTAAEKLNEETIYDPTSGRQLSQAEIRDWLETITAKSYQRLILEALGYEPGPKGKTEEATPRATSFAPTLIPETIQAPVPTDVEAAYRRQIRGLTNIALITGILATLTVACSGTAPAPTEIVTPTQLPTEVPPTATEVPPTATAIPTEAPTAIPTEVPTLTPEQLEDQAIEAYIDTLPPEIVPDEATRQKIAEILRETKNFERNEKLKIPAGQVYYRGTTWLKGHKEINYENIEVQMYYYGGWELQTEINGEQRTLYYGLMGTMPNDEGQPQLDGTPLLVGWITDRKFMGPAGWVGKPSLTYTDTLPFPQNEIRMNSFEEFNNSYKGRALAVRLPIDDDYIAFNEALANKGGVSQEIIDIIGHINRVLRTNLGNGNYRQSVDVKRGSDFSPIPGYIYISDKLLQSMILKSQ